MTKPASTTRIVQNPLCMTEEPVPMIEGSKVDPIFSWKCFSMPSVGPGCFEYLPEGVKMCIGDCESKGVLVRQVSATLLEVTPLEEREPLVNPKR